MGILDRHDPHQTICFFLGIMLMLSATTEYFPLDAVGLRAATFFGDLDRERERERDGVAEGERERERDLGERRLTIYLFFWLFI